MWKNRMRLFNHELRTRTFILPPIRRSLIGSFYWFIALESEVEEVIAAMESSGEDETNESNS